MRTSVALRRHDFDPIAFVFGLLFTVSGLLFLVGRFDVFNHARWLWPGLLVLLGIAVLIGARGHGSQGSAGAAVEPRPVEDVHVPDLDSIGPPVGPEAFRLPGWPAPGGQRSKPETAGTDVLEPGEAPGHDQPTAEREESPTQVLDPRAETKVIEQPPKQDPPDRR